MRVVIAWLLSLFVSTTLVPYLNPEPETAEEAVNGKPAHPCTYSLIHKA